MQFGQFGWTAFVLILVAVALSGNVLKGAGRVRYRGGRFLSENEKAFIAKLDRAVGP